jgi:hypothetical protein
MLLRSIWPRTGNSYHANYRDVVRYTVGDSWNIAACQGSTTPKSRPPMVLQYKKEDDALKDAVEEHVAKNWKVISNQLPGRSEVHRR